MLHYALRGAVRYVLLAKSHLAGCYAAILAGYLNEHGALCGLRQRECLLRGGVDGAAGEGRLGRRSKRFRNGIGFTPASSMPCNPPYHLYIIGVR